MIEWLPHTGVGLGHVYQKTRVQGSWFHISAVCGWIFKILMATCHALSYWIRLNRCPILELALGTCTKRQIWNQVYWPRDFWSMCPRSTPVLYTYTMAFSSSRHGMQPLEFSKFIHWQLRYDRRQHLWSPLYFSIMVTIVFLVGADSFLCVYN